MPKTQHPAGMSDGDWDEAADQFYAPCDTDGAGAETVLAEVCRCASTWENGARLLGNVRADDIQRAAAAGAAAIDVARIEQALHMCGFTLATAKSLGRDAEDAYRSGGVPGLNNWRRQKREAVLVMASRARGSAPPAPNRDK